TMGASEVQVPQTPQATNASLVGARRTPPARSVRSLEPSVWARPNTGSRMRREPHVRFCERAAVKLHRATHRNIYVRSERAGQRGMERITRLIRQKLKLKVNEAKSAVARPQERKFLGFSFTAGSDIKRTIAPKSLERFKRRIRDITRRAKGVSIMTTMEELAPY